MAAVQTIVVQHPNSLSIGDITGIIGGIVQADAPVVIGTLPLSPTHQATAISYAGLGILGLDIFSQIMQAIAAAHATKAAT